MEPLRYADKRILIVEDQRPFLLLLRGLINTLGATAVAVAQSAEQAIGLCRKEKYDIIISDLHLGSERKNGFELIEELRIRKLVRAHTLFLLISADSARPIVLGSIERRPDDYLIKPFSQAQLKSRLMRAWKKRQCLLPVYEALHDDDHDEALRHAEELYKQETPFHRFVTQLLVELYWQRNKADQALTILEADERAMPALWTQIATARCHLMMNKPEIALTTAHQILQSNRFSPEAYDILADAEHALKNAEQSLSAIRQAVKLSPYSLDRQYHACRIGRENNDFELVTEASLAVWDLSKRSIHQNPAHWCNYVRSLLDAAEHAEDKRQKNRFQQECLLQVQRARFDDVLHRLNHQFDIKAYEHLVNARIACLDNKLLDAKTELVLAQRAIDERFEQVPAGFIPDSLKLLFDLGEFEDALELKEYVKYENIELDANSQYLMQADEADVANKLELYTDLNRRGITYYQEGKFAQAKDIFIEAQQLAPVNTGIALNLLQCLFKLLDKNKKPEPVLVKEAQRVYKMIKGMPLKPQYQEKFASLDEPIAKYLK